MKFNSQLMTRSRIAVAVVTLLSVALGWALFHDANMSRPAWNIKFAAAHTGHARAELEKIHRGVVDAATLWTASWGTASAAQRAHPFTSTTPIASRSRNT